MNFEPSNFIEDIIVNDLESGKHSLIYTRFPPEPNGYLHVGHSKSLCINFGIKEKFGLALDLSRHQKKCGQIYERHCPHGKIGGLPDSVRGDKGSEERRGAINK